jgi:hypothetical protein
MLSNDMKNRIQNIKEKVAKEEADRNGEENEIPLWKQNSAHVEDYWDDKKTGKLSDPRLKMAVMIIEEVFGTWLELRRMRADRKFSGHSNASKVQVIQNFVRRMLAVAKIEELQEMRAKEASMFSKFCVMLSAGHNIRMYSRKHGTVTVRKLFLSDDCKRFQYETGKYNPIRTFDVKQIYTVNKGMSNQVYPKARTKHKGNCFHINLLGNKTLDFEALNSYDFSHIYMGFIHLRRLACTHTSPFYIDKDGVPSRAVGSIIKSALPPYPENRLGYTKAETKRKKTARSEADLIRFRLAATQGLKAEYEKWSEVENEELKAFKDAQKQARDLERKLASEEEAAAAAAKKASAANRDEDSDSEDEKEARMEALDKHVQAEYKAKAAFVAAHINDRDSSDGGRKSIAAAIALDGISDARANMEDDGNSSDAYSFTESEDEEDLQEYGDVTQKEREARRIHGRVQFAAWPDFQAQLEEIYYEYAPEKVHLATTLCGHFKGRETTLLLELYKKYHVDMKHAYLFLEPEKDKSEQRFADEDSDDTRRHGDESSGSESDGYGGRQRKPPTAKVGTMRWKHEHFKQMDALGIRHDDHHSMESESLHPSEDSELGPLLFGGTIRSGPKSSSEDLGAISLDERAMARQRKQMEERFEKMYSSDERVHHGNGDENYEDSDDSSYEEDNHDLFPGGVHQAVRGITDGGTPTDEEEGCADDEDDNSNSEESYSSYSSGDDPSGNSGDPSHAHKNLHHHHGHHLLRREGEGNTT